jgi:glycerate dehydrogenase
MMPPSINVTWRRKLPPQKPPFPLKTLDSEGFSPHIFDMKIIVLDGYTLNPGDLSWSPLLELGDCVIYDRTGGGEILARSAGADILLTNKTPITAATIGQLPSLRYIGVLATGYNIVDVAAATAAAVRVTNVPAYSTPSVVQLVFAHLLNLAHQFSTLAYDVRRGRWSESPDFSFWNSPMIELSGKQMGIVGFGRIGRDVARTALSLGMRVVACSGKPIALLPDGVRELPLEELLRTSDVVTLHCPLNEATSRLINADRLSLMKNTAWLINTGRGGLIDETALAAALDAGRLAGAGLDVLSTEPPARENPLPGARNCFVTPHVGWATVEARKRLMNEVVENVRAFQRGDPRNVVGG